MVSNSDKVSNSRIRLVAEALKLPSEYRDTEIASTINLGGVNIGVNKRGHAVFVSYYKEEVIEE